jgi:hypothetical protein
LQVAGIARPRECVDTEFAYAFQHRHTSGLDGHVLQWLLLKRDGIQANEAARQHGLIA